MIQKVAGFISRRGTEIIAGALLSVGIAVLGIGISAQVALQERVTDSALCIARGEERIQALAAESILRDQSILDQLARIQAATDVKDEGVKEMVQDLRERLDQRCDTLEVLVIGLINEPNVTRGE